MPEQTIQVEISPSDSSITIEGEATVIEIVDDDEIDIITVAEPGPPGARGVDGVPGPPGDPGPPGAPGGSYVFLQSIPQSVWIIDHNLSSVAPALVVVDSAGTAQEGDVSYPLPTRVVVTFGAPFSGTATLNA